MNIIQKLFIVGYSGIILVLVGCGVALIVFALIEFWHGINPSLDLPLRERFNAVLECIGWLTIAVVAFELGQTILEEEVQRSVPVSSPTRVRRFLSRFMVVVIVALSIETLVSVFVLAQKDASQLPQAASVGVAAAVMLAAWGIFIKMNKSAEDLEPEAMAETKSEDKKIESD